MEKRRRRSVRPRLVSLEGRELLSGVIAVMAKNSPHAPSAIGTLSKHMATVPTDEQFVVPSGNAGGVDSTSSFINNKSSPLLGNGPLSPSEAAREAFRAGFNGRVYTGPGRFSDQSTTSFYRGIGGSSFFLHGDFDMAIVTPTDPAKPFLGEAIMNDKSTNSGGLVGLVLSGSRSAVDSQGRPTHLTFNVDANIYSGIFFVDAGNGTVDITYGANNTTHVSFNGRIYTNGLSSPLVNSDLYARQGRPVKFHPGTHHH